MLKEFLLKLSTPKELSEEEKHQKFINQAYHHRNKSHKWCQKLILFFMASYLLFFTSRFWLPSTEKIKSPVLWTEYSLGVHQATLVRYDYCPAQKRAEIEFDLSETSYEEGAYSYAATEEGVPLVTTVVYESNNSLVINISGIQKEKHNLYFSLGWMRSEEDYDQIKLTYPIRGLNQVKDLTPKTELEYQTQRINITIQQSEQAIKELVEDREKQQTLIENIEEKNQELTSELSFKTEEQQKEIQTQIANNITISDRAKSQIALDNTQIANYQEEINNANALKESIKSEK